MKAGIKDCVKSFASKTGCTVAEADKAMRTAVEVIKYEIINKGGVSFIGLFSIEAVDREDRNGVHPITKEPYVIPAHRTLKLTVGKQLKEELNK